MIKRKYVRIIEKKIKKNDDKERILKLQKRERMKERIRKEKKREREK